MSYSDIENARRLAGEAERRLGQLGGGDATRLRVELARIWTMIAQADKR